MQESSTKKEDQGVDEDQQHEFHEEEYLVKKALGIGTGQSHGPGSSFNQFALSTRQQSRPGQELDEGQGLDAELLRLNYL